MNLQPRKETIVGQAEFLKSTQGAIFKVGGITLKGSAFPDGNVIKAGTAVMKDTDGLFIPYQDAGDATAGYSFPEGAEVYLTTHDIVNKGGNAIVGALIEGYVKTSRLTGVTDAFKTAMKHRYIFA